MENAYFEGLPLSPEQRFILAWNGPGEAGAILAIAMHGAVDEPRLRAALSAVVAAHESLRMAFRRFPGYRSLRQQPLSPALSWETVDLRAASDAEQRVAERVRRERATAFDLEQGRLVRGVLFRIEDGRWRLVLAVARPAADRLSLEILYQTLLDAYARPAAGASETVQYPQFVEWRRELEQGEDAEAGRGYWAGLGLDALHAPRLPYRLRSTESQSASSERACVRQHLDEATAAGLSRLAEARGWPVETVLQAAWWALLARISGESAFAGGWQHDCRRDYEVLAGAVGVFDKILPLPVAVFSDEPFSAWVERLGRNLEDHRGWQEYWPVAEPPYGAHLSVGFALAGRPAPCDVAELHCQVHELPGPSPVFELALQAVLDEAGRPGSVGLHYACARYCDTAVQYLMRQYLTLLAALPTHAFEPIADLPLVGPEEQKSLLALNGATLDVGQQTLPACIAHWAAASPTAPALAARDLNLSYAVLNARINRLAHWLGQHGVGPGGVPVALLLPRSGELVVALLAVLRAGGAYLPLDPDWPEGRRQKIVADAKPRLVLTHGAIDPGGMGDVHCIGLDTLEDELAACPESPPAVAIGLDQAAYILYTSGSTGEPKGVVIEHGQLLNYVAAVSAALDLAERRRFALTSTVAADLGNTALFGAFFNGGCLVVADRDDMQDAASFARFMIEQNIDCLKIVPSHLAALLDTESVALPHTLIFGGEATPRTLVERIARLDPDCRIHNHYGPTETTVGVMTHTFDPQQAWYGDALPLTRPLANCRVYLLDEARRLVPAGALGELYLGGAQVCRGYLNRPAADAFIDDPFRPGERLYRSGDLGRYLPGGGLQLAGRTDQQLKIRGFRIEPAEVELALRAIPGIRQAAVRAWGEGEQRRLFAYVVMDRAAADDLDEAVLQDELKRQLPGAMIPARVFVLPELPRLANGKTDRQALPDPADLSKKSEYVAPRDAVETVLANIWAELLKREKVGVTDSFFDLGGHSLLVIKLVARIRKLLQVEILPGLVFDHSSIETLAQALRRFESEPGQLERVAALRQRLMSLSPEEREALLEKARQGSAASEA